MDSMMVNDVIEKCSREHKGAVIHNGHLIGFVDDEMKGEMKDDEM